MYATEVAFAYATRNTEVAERTRTYGISGVSVDGNDAGGSEAMGEAVSRARSGKGPTFIEGKTYRTRAHAEGMRDAGYRTPEEVNSWKRRDPIVIIAPNC